MRIISIILQVLVCLFLLTQAGCETGPEQFETPAEFHEALDRLSLYTSYSQVKIDIMPLTEVIKTGEAQQARINIYASLLDAFSHQIKAPGVFRFELYQYVQRSSEPKGKRIVLWPDIDLTDPVINSEYWRDFLRAYEFNFPFTGGPNQNYILEATCLCPSGKRLTDEFILKQSQ
jgi:hypothetical protein